MKRFAMIVAMGGMAVMTALPSLASGSGKSQTMSGFISDAKCAATKMVSSPECVKKCIAKGQKAVFVDDKKEVWKIDNQDAVPVDDEGRNVKVTATLNEASHTMHIIELKKTMGSEIKSKI